MPTCRFKKGFTLAELLVVVSIISVLILMSIGYFAGATKRGRDARRRADLEQIRSALEMYRVDHITFGYPATLPELEPAYIREIPPDPLKNSDRSYEYQRISSTTYRLGALLENGNPDTATACLPAGSIVCTTSGTACNYCLLNP